MIKQINNRISQLGIKSRVISIVVLTLLISMVFFNIYSYYSVGDATDNEVAQLSDAIGVTLAESSRLAFADENYDDLQQTLDDLVDGNRAILKLAVLDVKRDVILFNKAKSGTDDRQKMFSYPIIKKANVIKPYGDEAGALQPLASASGAPVPQRKVIGYIEVTLSHDVIAAKHWHLAVMRSYVLMTAAFASLIISYFLSDSVARPIRKALAALKTIRDGKYNQQVDVTTRGEIGDMQATINQITLNMDESIVELENKVTARTIELQKSRDAIARSDSEKRRLIQKVHSIVEDERKSIAAEIHDELNATLIAAKLSSQRIMNLASGDDIRPNTEDIKAQAQHIIQLTSSLYTSARNIVRRLRPEILDMLGLQGAVNDMIENYNAMHGDCHFSFTTDGDLSIIPAELEITLYRLIQEALSNVMKHASASEVHVDLRNDESRHQLLVSVTDNGKGFSPNINEQGIGIIGMKERTYAFHGDFEIISKEGGGTTVVAVFPLEEGSAPPT